VQLSCPPETTRLADVAIILAGLFTALTIVGLGIALLNADAARDVFKKRRRKEKQRL
jgi:hypothetical protein